MSDRYELHEPLGRGAMGEVRRATDRVLGRPVAVKLLHPDGPGQAAANGDERFRLEARTAARLSHRNLVGVYDVGSWEGRPCLVMEFVDGWTLAEVRRMCGVLPWEEATGIAAQLADGLAAAHRRGVIHRDIKPANVMLTADGGVKITDFGIACFTDEAAGGETPAEKIVGSAAYLAPERALGRPCGPASDVYSLGCVLYELLFGRPPFTGATSLLVAEQQVNAPAAVPDPFRAETPEPLADYVLRLLAKDPGRRPTAEQAAAWLAAPGRPPGASASPPVAPAGPPPSPAATTWPSPAKTLPAVPRPPVARRISASRHALGSVGGLVMLAVSATFGAVLTGAGGGTAPGPGPVLPASAPATGQPGTVPAPPSGSGTAEEEQQKAPDGERGRGEQTSKERNAGRSKDGE
ncbi:serine/threonine-protein kinase [Streptomyces sp. NPDC058741]|uniref:serine/threonine-protein kinase n=1 Tax=Streptomyces sp. NPDC058741 TaxID=3346620 RepID=UPI003678054C